mgnify:CR=1 FL=1
MATARAVPPPGMFPVDIVPMRRRHLRSVLRIEDLVYPRPWSMSLFLSEMNMRSSRCYLVARSRREVIGYAGLMMSLDDAHVTTVAVDPAWQRRHVGARLLLAIAREALARGAANLTLEVRASNVGARDLYRRFGFEAVGLRKGYYADSGEDAIVMWAHHADGPEYGALLDALERTFGDPPPDRSASTRAPGESP